MNTFLLRGGRLRLAATASGTETINFAGFNAHGRGSVGAIDDGVKTAMLLATDRFGALTKAIAREPL